MIEVLYMKEYGLVQGIYHDICTVHEGRDGLSFFERTKSFVEKGGSFRKKRTMDEQIRSFREMKKDFGQKSIIQKQNSKLKSLRNKINNENLNLYIRKKVFSCFSKIHLSKPVLCIDYR